MPTTRVEREYLFAGPQGEVSLADVFAGRSQLILYRFFFEEGVSGWPDAGCVGCSSSWADGVADLNLLHARDITFAKVLSSIATAVEGVRRGWAGPTRPGRRSDPTPSRRTSEPPTGSLSTCFCARGMTS